MFKLKKLSLAQSFIGALICFGAALNSTGTACAATSSIIIDAENGEILSSKAPDTLRYPASLTKVMTLYITFDALNKGIIKMNDDLKVSRHAANMAPSRLGLRPGQKIKVKTCIEALIVKSANDCASVLAENLGYTEANFAKTMTKVAHELGMKNTTFKNANGLPNKAQKTTARDMALLAAAMYHHFPQYYKLFSLKKFTYNGKTIYTHNNILKTFAGADGMKTGFTNAAGYNIITSAQRDGKRVIAVTMAHNSAKERDRHVARMMDKGLKRLALNDKFQNTNMYASLDEKKLETAEETKVADNGETSWDISSRETAENVKKLEKDNRQETPDQWGIQIGAFSNYAKARSYALKIKKAARKLADKEIDIEPVANGSAVIYRSKIIGFAKSDADKACKNLKKKNKSCIVVAVRTDNQLVLANSQY